MASVQYEEIFNSFLGNVEDYDFNTLEEYELYEMFTEYLKKSLSQYYIATLFSSLDLDDNTETFSYELEYPINDFVDNAFVIFILGKAMTLEWINPRVQSTTNIQQAFSGKEQKFYSQSAHISELRGLKSDIESEIRHLIMDRGYINNSYLE